MVNPFEPSQALTQEKGVFADGAKLIRRTLLYRSIEFTLPFAGKLVYDGWWFWQRVTINGDLVWSKISWLRIEPSITFQLSDSIDPKASVAQIEIQFGPGLLIRRFQVIVNGVVAYDEIC